MDGKEECNAVWEQETYCKVGTIPLTPVPAPGVAAGVAGVTTLAEPVFSGPCKFFCPPLTLFCCSNGGVRSPVPPGKDRDAGLVKAFAWSALLGCEFKVSIMLGWRLGVCLSLRARGVQRQSERAEMCGRGGSGP